MDRLCDWLNKSFLLLVLFSVSNLAPLYVRAQDRGVEAITVGASAEVSVKPDFAVVVFGVDTLEKNASAATSKNAQIFNQVEKILRDKFKLEPEDMRTTEYRLTAEYTYSNSPSGASKREFAGYRAVNQIAVTMKQIEKLGQLLDSVSAAGINSVQGIEFDSSKRRESELEALRLATDSARRKADVIAKAAGRSVKRLIRADEGVSMIQDPGPRPMMMKAMAADAGGTSISPGSLKVTAQVTAQYMMQ